MTTTSPSGNQTGSSVVNSTAPLTGDTLPVFVADRDAVWKITPAGTLANLTVPMPLVPIGCVAKICTTKDITNLNITFAGTVYNTAVSMNAGDMYEFTRTDATTYWREL